MPLVKTLQPGEEPAANETAVRLQNNTGGSLTIGILQGEYLKFAPGVASGYALTTSDQHVRYQRQITLQPTYAQWFSLGYLTPPPPPPPEPEPEEESMSTTPTEEPEPEAPTQQPGTPEPTPTPEPPVTPEAPTQLPGAPEPEAPTPYGDDGCR